MATTGPGITALVPGPQIHLLQGQRLLFFLVAIVLITTSSTFIVHRLHLIFDLNAVQDQQLKKKSSSKKWRELLDALTYCLYLFFQKQKSSSDAYSWDE
jgi:hypothetical protein